MKHPRSEMPKNGPVESAEKQGRSTFQDLRDALFPDGLPGSHSLKELKAGLESSIRNRHGRH